MPRRRTPLWPALPLALLLGSPVVAALAQGTPKAATVPALTFAAPDLARGAAIAANCAGCHGPGNVSPELDTPSLAGQTASYLRRQLAAYRAGLRQNAVMQRVAGQMNDQAIADVSAHLATLAPGPAWDVQDAAARAKGQALYAAGDPARALMACAVCHGADGRGDDRLGVAGVTNLAPDYALAELKRYHGAGLATLPGAEGQAMGVAARPLTDDDMAALVEYISSMK